MVRSSVRLAAMYSGGKDSTFAMYIAEQYGYEIPYLVAVIPENKESFVFHTPNLSSIPFMAEAMGKEFVSVKSEGNDEDSDLEAMKKVLSTLDIDGVVVGTLWSDYQWDRMNRICDELNLVFIAPLWRKSQDLIYKEMVSSGITAIIVGVFAEGLDETWLGRELNDTTFEELYELRKKYGISVMGEGGEYESMTLDSPMHSKRLQITAFENKMERNVGVMEITQTSLVDKS